MPFWNRRPIARYMLAKKDGRVGYLQVPDAFELAHYYHAIAKSPGILEHQFCYRNYGVVTFTLKRKVATQGPARYEETLTSKKLVLVARQDRDNPTEVTEYPACATLSPFGKGDLTTTVTLSPVPPFDARLPATLSSRSVGPVTKLDVCCKHLQ